ncbi:MAG: hypothetical protein AAF629_02485, partial [Chloroflexota bacterium]
LKVNRRISFTINGLARLCVPELEDDVDAAVSPTLGYNHFMQSVAVGPSGSIHIIFQFWYAESGQAIDCKGYAAIHLQSDDGGNRWFNEGRHCNNLPLTINTMRPLTHQPNGGIRVGNLLIDSQNQPVFYAADGEISAGLLWYRRNSHWDAIDMAIAFHTLPQGLNSLGGRSTSLSRDGEGNLYFAIAADPTGQKTPWYHPSLELFTVKIAPNGSPLDFTQQSQTDADVAHWLPAWEQWDWTRPTISCQDGPWLLYTQGLNQGGIGGNNANTLQTKVLLGKPG